MNWVLVLAAGRGVRAGGPKALHVVHGCPWWQSQHDRLKSADLPAVWVVSERVRASMLASGNEPEHVVVADDTAPMFASIAAGVREIAWVHAAPSGAFVLPVDVPAPGSDIFATLAHAIADPTAANAAIPTYRGHRGHPVFLRWEFVTSRVLPADPGGARLDRLIAEACIEVPVQNTSVLANLNTAEDFAAWASMNR